MIQQSVNQLLGTVGIMARLSPDYETKIKAKEIGGAGLSAQRGLEDISRALSNENKELSNIELEDMEKRAKQHNYDINTLKTMALEGQPTAKYLQGAQSKLLPQSEYNKMLTSIEGNIEKRRKALDSMRQKAQSAIQQDNEFKQHKSIILDSYGNPMIKEK